MLRINKVVFHGIVVGSIMLLFVCVPSSLQARRNSVTLGLATSLDYSDRQFESLQDDPETTEDESLEIDTRDEDYRRIVISPLIKFESSSPRDSIEFRVAPGIKYDLDDSETDWDNNLYLGAYRYLTSAWQVRLSNAFIRSDYYREDPRFEDPTVVTPQPQPQTGQQGDQPQQSQVQQQVTDDADPELSSDIGRRRYWRNSLNINTDYMYKADSSVLLGFSYIVLRNDDDSSGRGGVNDYDRYVLRFNNDHSFNQRWQTNLDLRFIRGDFEPRSSAVVESVVEDIAEAVDTPPDEGDLSNDLKEYQLLFTLENQSIAQNPLSFIYNYIGTDYDDDLRDDGDIHQFRLVWRRDYNPRLYTRLGAGISYEKTDERDSNTDWNGLAEANYLIPRGSFNFLLEKRYDVDNFSGTNERGFIDLWIARFGLGYQLSRDLSLNFGLSYRHEDRRNTEVAVGRALLTEDPLETLVTSDIEELEAVEKDQYRATLGLRYEFWQHYAAGLRYTYLRQESDRLSDDYDDHRVLLTLSWSKEMFRW